jgi:hypothetical protein
MNATAISRRSSSQNIRAKADKRFAQWREPDTLDLARTAAVARLIFGPGMNIQITPVSA